MQNLRQSEAEAGKSLSRVGRVDKKCQWLFVLTHILSENENIDRNRNNLFTVIANNHIWVQKS